MSRALYIGGWAYVAIAAAVLLVRPSSGTNGVGFAPVPPAAGVAGNGAAWFARMKPFCNPLEIELRMRGAPAPPGVHGAGFAAACWAVAGRIDRARAVIDALPAADRPAAAGVVFEVGHPIADMGDDLSAGPIMALVVDYQPANYMALYHAGIAYDATGRPDLARRHLVEFLRLYEVEDGWRSNARAVLGRLERAR
jgi:hypothetical protein